MTLPGALPWFVAIFVEGEHICDGSIIHESFVVTSVQCALMIYQAETRLEIYFLVFIRTLYQTCWTFVQGGSIIFI